MEEASQLLVFPSSESTTEALGSNVDKPEERISQNIAQVDRAILYSYGMNITDYNLVRVAFNSLVRFSKRRVFLPFTFDDPSLLAYYSFISCIDARTLTYHCSGDMYAVKKSHSLYSGDIEFIYFSALTSSFSFLTRTERRCGE